MTETLSELQERPQVLAAIRPYYEQRGLVKVLTGMRRVGKSTVLLEDAISVYISVA